MADGRDAVIATEVAGGCPHLAGYDPLAPEELRDPYPSFAVARAQAPVFFSPEWGMWSVARKEDVLAVLRDNENYSASRALPVTPPPPEVIGRMPEYPWAKSLLLLDEPLHRPARAVVQAPFTPRSLRGREPVIRQIGEGLLSPWVPKGRIDFINEYALPLSLAVIGDILGIPTERFDLLREGVYQGFALMSGSLTDHEDVLAAAEPLAELYGYLGDLVEERRAEPRDDYTSVMVQTRKEDGTLESTPEMIKHVYQIVGAGFETSAQMLAHGMGAILERPDQWQALRDDPGLLDGAVEEMLRYRTLVKRIFRVANRDMEVAGVTIPAGALVTLLLASADRDEDAYEDPDEFDITRGGDHLAFGKWKHFCVGAPLARLEMRITLELMIEMLPDARVAADQELEWRPDIRLDAVTRFDLEWEPRPTVAKASR